MSDIARSRRHLDVPTPLISLDRSAHVPLYEQLYSALRTAIVEGRIPSGTRIPSSRALAADLDVSRNTVIAVYEQLCAEGYVAGRTGSGTFVSAVVPDDTIASGPVHARQAVQSDSASGLSQFGRVAEAHAVRPAPFSGWVPFVPGAPDASHFPVEIWRELTARQWRRLSQRLLSAQPPAGYAPLREAVAAYLGTTRGLACTPEQVIIIAGTQQGLSLAARVLLEPGQKVWVENPGYGSAWLALHAAGSELVPVSVDSGGLNVAEGISLCANAAAVYVTPSNQFPLGITMSAGRRLALLEWASTHGAWILEDDYDSEFRYSGRPVAALQGMDTHSSVIYFGTFSKVLFPSLRLGYMIAPLHLASTFAAAQAIDNGPVGVIEQAVLADFFFEGHFARHVRRMRKLYAERQEAFLEMVRRELSDLLTVSPAPAGMHLVGMLPPGVDDRSVAGAAAAAGIRVLPISTMTLGPPPQPGGLILGYAGGDVPLMQEAIPRLRSAIHSVIANT